MWALLTFAVLGASPSIAGDALAPYRGQPVLSVDVTAADEDEAAELRELIDIQPGFLLVTDDIQEALKRLYALGRFADVGVTAERLSGTVSLHFYVEPIRRLVNLDIDGTEEVDVDAFRAALGFDVGDEIDSRSADRLAQRALNYLLRAGFPRAEVDVRVLLAPDTPSAEVALRVREGRPLRVERLRFVGRPRLKREGLAGLVQTEVGAVLNRYQIDEDRQTLQQRFRQHGFMMATVAEPEVRVDGDFAEVLFTIEAGDRIVIELHGNTLFSHNDLMRLWAEPDGPLRRSAVTLFRDRILDAYRRRGYFGVRARVQESRDAGAEVLTFRIAIDEGIPHRVSAIRFTGAKAFQPKLLRRQIEATLSAQLRDPTLIQRMTKTEQCLAFAPKLGAATCDRTLVDIEQRWVPEIYEEALTAITGAYRNLGYLSARIGPAAATVETGDVQIDIPVVEGPQTVITSIGFRDNEAFAAVKLLDTIEGATSRDEVTVAVRPGAPFSASGVEDGRIAILRAYRDLGYLYAQVFTEVILSPDRETAEVAYRFEEGPQVRIGRILVRGNRFTREGVIRSRVSIESGDLYRLEQAVQDRRAIAQLGVFSNVRVKLIDEERPAERKDLVAEVAERNRQPVEFFVGVSSAEGPRVGASYSHINLFGTASTGTISAQMNRQVFFGLYGVFAETMRDAYSNYESPLNQIEREVRAGVRSPRLVGLPLDPSARIDIVHDRANPIPFDLESYTLILGTDLSLSDSLTLALEPQASFSELGCRELPQESIIQTRCRGTGVARTGLTDEGVRSAIKVGPSLTLDLRDNPFNPRSGLYANLKASYAAGKVSRELGAAASDFTFVRFEGNVTGYLSTPGPVIALSARGGLITRRIGPDQTDERFYLGGRSNLRGFVQNTLIPSDACVYFADDRKEDGTPVDAPTGCEAIPRTRDVPPLTNGGNVYLLFKSEVRLPLTADFSLGLFVDIGNLWVEPPKLEDLTFRVGGGAGLRYNTPVGPLAFDLAFNSNPVRRNAETNQQLHFSVGVF